jgi:hypothetical protein
MELNQVLRLSPDLIWRVVEDGAVLVTPADGRITVLNGVGTHIWQLIDGRRTASDILDSLVQTYQVDEQQAYQDLDQFVADLSERRLLILD